ncbi:MAG: ComEC/Rec2 family competence protein [Endomicrobiia bacterium]
MLHYFYKITILLLCNFSLLFSSVVKIYFLDVKEGDATFIITSTSKTILIDTGHDKFDSGKYIYEFVKSKNFDKIDFMIISHPHRDHIGGAKYLLLNMKIENFYESGIVSKSDVYREILNIVTEKKINYKIIREKDRIKLDNELEAYIFHPPREAFSYTSINNNSLVFKIVYKKFSVLFTGDIEKKAEREIIKRYIYKHETLKSDILKVPHHGSNSSSTDAFIRLVNPKFAIIFCGINNRYGHPHKEVIERYKRYNVSILRVDMDGIIEIITDGKQYKVKTYKQ